MRRFLSIAHRFAEEFMRWRVRRVHALRGKLEEERLFPLLCRFVNEIGRRLYVHLAGVSRRKALVAVAGEVVLAIFGRQLTLRGPVGIVEALLFEARKPARVPVPLEIESIAWLLLLCFLPRPISKLPPIVSLEFAHGLSVLKVDERRSLDAVVTLKDVVKPELVAIPAVILRGTYRVHIMPAAHTLRFLLLPCRAEHGGYSSSYYSRSRAGAVAPYSRAKQ
eukprot:scaffold22676_cov60-Phaeocystis_antarctica.AAC.1